MQDAVAAPESENQPAPVAVGLAVRQGAEAAHDRRNVGERRDARRETHRREHRRAAARDPGFRQSHQFDHALVRFLRVGSKSKDAVLQQNHAVHVRRCVVDGSAALREAEARHDIRYQPHAAPERLAAQLRPVRLIDEAQHRGRVRMVDELVRKKRVQQRFHRGIRCHGIDQAGAHEAHHFCVRQCVETPHEAQCLEPYRGKAGGFNRRHVPTGPFDAEHRDLGAHEVGNGGLHRGIAAAMQDEARIAAEQSRRIDAQREVTANALPGVAVHHVPCIVVGPSTEHAPPPRWNRQRCAAGQAPCRSRYCRGAQRFDSGR